LPGQLLHNLHFSDVLADDIEEQGRAAVLAGGVQFQRQFLVGLGLLELQCRDGFLRLAVDQQGRLVAIELGRQQVGGQFDVLLIGGNADLAQILAGDLRAVDLGRQAAHPELADRDRLAARFQRLLVLQSFVRNDQGAEVVGAGDEVGLLDVRLHLNRRTPPSRSLLGDQARGVLRFLQGLVILGVAGKCKADRQGEQGQFLLDHHGFANAFRRMEDRDADFPIKLLLIRGSALPSVGFSKPEPDFPLRLFGLG